MKTKQPWLLISVLASLLTWLAYEAATLPPPGYCVGKGRILADEEFMESVIRNLAWRINVDISETAIRSYRTMYPWCCEVERERNKVIVHLVFEQNKKTRSSEGTSRYYEIYEPYDMCGTPMQKQSFGIEISEDYYLRARQRYLEKMHGN